MTEETVTPSHETFDILDALQGATFPEDTVDFFLDENLNYLVNKTNNELKQLEYRGQTEKAESLKKHRDELLESAVSKKFTATVRAVPDNVREAIDVETEEKHPAEQDIYGREKTSPERDAFFMAKYWAAHVVKITNPTGVSQIGMTFDQASAFRKTAPRSAVLAIQDKINELYSGSKAGYQDIVQESNFLSDASPEA